MLIKLHWENRRAYSMFATGLWIRIRMDPHSFYLLYPDPDPDPWEKKISNKNRKSDKKLVNTASLFIFKVNFHKVNCFLLLSNLLCCFLQLKKTLHKVILYNFFGAGSGSAFRTTAGSRTAKKCLRIHSPGLLFPICCVRKIHYAIKTVTKSGIL